MPQSKPGIATTILVEREGEGFVEIPSNKTLFIQQLTFDAPQRPEIVKEKIETIDAVFERFKPECTIDLEKEDGSTTPQKFEFKKLSDFSVKSLIGQSPFLTNLNIEHDAHLKIVKQLGNNRTLQNVIANNESKQAFIDVLKSLVSELENNKA